ncbi:MAG: choice-of-anchor A family protein [Caldilineaceae bacterium]|nr:choice-of-anchor A family protein [Caldilineaceae bacterium]
MLLALMLTGLLGFAGLAIDGSNLYYQQQRMQIAADAAALGGARQLGLNANHDTVDSTIRHLATENYATSVNWTPTNGGRGVHVEAARNFEAFFAKIYGYDTFTVTAQSEAQYEPVTGVDRLFPLTVDCDCVDDGLPIPPMDEPGDGDNPGGEEEPQGCSNLYPIALSIDTLRGKSAGNELGDIFNGVQSGNFGWLSWEDTNNTPDLIARLTPPGNSHLYINPDDPDDHVVSIGDWVSGSPGVANAGGVRSALDVLKTMDIIVPVWDQATGNGSNSLYRVANFAKVRITDYRLPSQNRITATFLGYDDTCGVGGSGTIDTGQAAYEVKLQNKVGNTWNYQVRKISGSDLSHWSLGISTCLDKVVRIEPSGGALQVDGIRWTTAEGFESGTFSFTLNGNYPAGMVDAQVLAGSQAGTVSIQGPICDGTGGGDLSAVGVCLSTLDFEADDAGASLLAGQIVDNEWASWGVGVTTSSPANHPAMIFDSAHPTGNDPDLGSPHQDFGGPGRGIGGGSGKPGENRTPQGKVLIVAESNNPAMPDDAAGGGTLVFAFDYPVRIDEVHILDIDDAGAAGTVKAYSAKSAGDLVATGRMLGLGDNSTQVVAVDAAAAQRLEVNLPKGGAVSALVSCRNQQTAHYRLGDLIWSDTNSNGLQDSGEPGIAGVNLELYASGQSNLVAQTMTNISGKYLFPDIPPGSYSVKVAPSNFGEGGPLAGALYSPANVGGGAPATATPIPLPTATATATPTSAPSSCQVNYQIASQWGNGFNADVTLTNQSASNWNGWTVNWTFAGNQTITNIWNGKKTQTGQQVEVRDAGHNKKVNVGATVSFGFQASYSGANAIPASFSVNGQPCSGTAAPTAMPTATPTATTPPAATATPTPTGQPGGSGAVAAMVSWMNQYNLVVLDDLQSFGEVDYRAFIGGNFTSGNSAQFGGHMSGSTACTDRVLTVVGNIAAGNPLNMQKGSLAIKGTTNNRAINYNGGSGCGKITDSSLSDAQITADMQGASAALAAIPANNNVPALDAGGNLYFRVTTKTAAGLAVFNVSAGDVFNRGNMIEFANDAGATTILVNVSGASINWTQGNMGNFMTSYSPNIAKVIWNFHQLTSFTTNSKRFAGALLAPYAAVNAGSGNLEGSTVVKTLVSAGEIHDPVFSLNNIPPLTSVAQPTPTAAPTVAPTATPTATPVPTSNDTTDSDCISSTGQAPAVVSGGDNLTVDCGFILPPTPTPGASPTPTPGASPTPSGSPTPTGEAPVCSFSWLDWDGVTSSYQELYDNMADTRRSGTWYVGNIVQPGPPVSPNLYTEAGLTNLVGKKVRIPLSEYNGNGYAICGFVEVKLLDYALQDEARWLSLDWLISVIRSAESDPAGLDFGARDVRVLR